MIAEGEGGEGGGEGEGAAGPKRRKRSVELNPEATLESSLAALNVKKFDLAFDVDPLFHKTTAQFDEGGAKGGFLRLWHSPGCTLAQGCTSSMATTRTGSSGKLGWSGSRIMCLHANCTPCGLKST